MQAAAVQGRGNGRYFPPAVLTIYFFHNAVNKVERFIVCYSDTRRAPTSALRLGRASSRMTRVPLQHSGRLMTQRRVVPRRWILGAVRYPVAVVDRCAADVAQSMLYNAGRSVCARRSAVLERSLAHVQ